MDTIFRGTISIRTCEAKVRRHILRLVSLTLLAATSLAIPRSTAGAQTLAPGEQVRVTVRQQGVNRRETGWLISVSSDTISLLRSRRDSVHLARSELVRLERRRHDVDLGRSIGIGCLAGGAVLGGLGLITRDPDSPGIERRFAVVGFVVGCFGGGAFGLLTGVMSRGPWEEVVLAGPAG